jgi:hypothetical protein
MFDGEFLNTRQKLEKVYNLLSFPVLELNNLTKLNLILKTIIVIRLNETQNKPS